MTQHPLLDALSSPADLRLLEYGELQRLAEEIRATIIEVVGHNGGHLASNLGIVELTLALHRVFDFSRDQLHFDVGHQCYVHKLLTGRRDAFPTLRTRNGISGFPNPRESDFDPMAVGHASTSISSALGFAVAIRDESPRRNAVAIIGDGSIGGGMAFEALNHAGQIGADILVILNDNEMSISATTGAFAAYLTDLRTRPTTRSLREHVNRFLGAIPLAGKTLANVQNHILSGVKSLAEATPIFSALGFRYFGPLDGHDQQLLETELTRIKDMRGPRLLHISTEKGRGFAAAAADPEGFHSASPFRKKKPSPAEAKERPTYTEAFAQSLLRAAKRDPAVVAITAAMPTGTGLKKFAATFPDRFHDVGICEAHAVTFAASLAKAGKKPVLVLYSTFLQRSYDQVVHDLALQGDLPVVIAIDRAGTVGSDGPTHHGVFDIAFLRHIPGLTLMSPRNGEELGGMLDLALTLPGPSAIRYPRGTIPPTAGTPEGAVRLTPGKSEILRTGSDGAIIAYGRMTESALRAAEIMAEAGAEITVVNARFAKPVDSDLLRDLALGTPWLATVEDHILSCGFGSAVLEFLSDNNLFVPLRRIGYPDHFIPHAEIHELDAVYGLTGEAIAAALQEFTTSAASVPQINKSNIY